MMKQGMPRHGDYAYNQDINSATRDNRDPKRKATLSFPEINEDVDEVIQESS